ncbi:MAG TPA: TIGR04283 family arsenosugar biosynthesis glycosyltransferase [Vicinamibacterales bacterium]|nr:TIGR04283 family arsenosugar biosynthesis glycosyltransferase [Vicinamibacterales bacterium]
MTPLVSVIVPILAADRDSARQLIARIPVDLQVETIVAEAGTELGLESLSQGRPDVTVVHTQQGRGQQMNAAAGLARGEWLLFLHADSQLPSDWLDLFETSVREHGTGPGPLYPRPGDIVGGWFQFALDDPAWQARLIERAVAWRVRLLRLPYGDQGLFVQRRTFAALGGYRDIELMEDVDFVRRMINAGAVIELPCALITSARRWRRDGWFRRSTRNLTLLALYFCGVPPRVLARWY